MDLYYKKHPSNLEIYVAPLANHENFWYADDLVKHFKPYSLGIYSLSDLEKFKRFALLHNHNIIIEGLGETK